MIVVVLIAIVVIVCGVLVATGKISIGRRGQTDPHEAAQHTAVRDAIKERATEAKAFRRRVGQAQTALTIAKKAHENLVTSARKQLDQVSKVPLIARAGAIQVFEDRVHTPEGLHPLDEHVRAAVDTAGNMAFTRRHTLTRFALLGPFSIFTPKATKHDDRELYFLIEHPEWASMVKLNPNAGTGARKAAMATNVAARNAAASRQSREKLKSDARQQLSLTEVETSGIQAAQKSLGVAKDSVSAVVERQDALRVLADGCSDQAARIVRKARKLTTEFTAANETWANFAGESQVTPHVDPN